MIASTIPKSSTKGKPPAKQPKSSLNGGDKEDSSEDDSSVDLDRDEGIILLPYLYLLVVSLSHTYLFLQYRTLGTHPLVSLGWGLPNSKAFRASSLWSTHQVPYIHTSTFFCLLSCNISLTSRSTYWCRARYQSYRCQCDWAIGQTKNCVSVTLGTYLY